MIYQLANGKVIYMSLEEYLNLSDDDIEFLISIDYGDYASSPWHGSQIRSKVKIVDENLDSYEEDEIHPSKGFTIQDDEDDFIDYTPE